MANILIYKIMFNPTVGKLFEIYQYFKTFSCNVRVSKNKDKRLIDSHSYIGLMSLGLHQYDEIHICFDSNINLNAIKNKLDLLSI
mgnify:CR=1 FL=1